MVNQPILQQLLVPNGKKSVSFERYNSLASDARQTQISNTMATQQVPIKINYVSVYFIVYLLCVSESFAFKIHRIESYAHISQIRVSMKSLALCDFNRVGFTHASTAWR